MANVTQTPAVNAKKKKQLLVRDPRWVAFGKRLVALRKARGWRALDVARLIEADPATISHLENGKRPTGPERPTLEALAELFEISVDELSGQQESRVRHAHAAIFPPADAGSGESGDARAPEHERADIRAAVYDAILALLGDLFELASTANRRRAATDDGRKVRSRAPIASGERPHRP